MSDSFAPRASSVNPARPPWGGIARNGVCADCLAEFDDPRSRRYRYSVISCHQCGPGYTITLRLPFARSNTTLAPFEPCERCRSEFEDPASRHFGSATVCCPDCGPSYWIEPVPTVDDGLDVGDDAVELLRAGDVLGLKDTCSFRLMALADEPEVIERLRRRLHRPDAAFSLMVPDLEAARTLAHVDTAAESLLLDPSAPRVVLPRRADDAWLDIVTAGSSEVAIMLPRAPIHYWIARAIRRPLVVVRAGRSDDVTVLENEDAREQLMDIADHLMLHDLDLHAGCEDTVMRVEDHGTVVMRRASGLVPRPLQLPRSVPPLLSIGGMHDASIAVAVGDTARLSQPIGDLGTPRADTTFQLVLDRMLSLWECVPEWIASDPTSESTAKALAERFGATPMLIDHHHAHVATVLAEHGIETRVLGVSLDATGHGLHTELGAAKLLDVDGAQTDELDRLPGFRVPGADTAPRDPWRTAVGLLYDLLGRDTAQVWAQRMATGSQTADSALSMLDHDIGCVRLNSFGRLYDAAAALLGVAHRVSNASTAAQRLELLAGSPDPSSWGPCDESRQSLPAWLEQLLDRTLDTSATVSNVRWVQRSLADWAADWVLSAAEERDLDSVVVGGGCLLNPWLRTGLRVRASERGLKLWMNQSIPPGDASLALGQMWIAAQRVAVSTSN